jgi:hypothetical protein
MFVYSALIDDDHVPAPHVAVPHAENELIAYPDENRPLIVAPSPTSS